MTAGKFLEVEPGLTLYVCNLRRLRFKEKGDT